MCGIAAVMQQNASNEIAQYIFTILLHQHHRGQNSAGIVVSREDGYFKKQKGLGTLDRVFFRMREEFKSLSWRGIAGIGHLRYATAGVNFSDRQSVEQAKTAIQPMRGNWRGNPFFMSFNGNLVPSCIQRLYQELYKRESPDNNAWRSCVDSELMIRSLETSAKQSFGEALLDTASQWDGAFSAVFLQNNTIYALRDPWGFRPLEFGLFANGYLVSSEDNIFDEAKLPGAHFLGSVKPGHCLILQNTPNGIREKIYQYRESAPRHCAFESIYFQRPDSRMYSGERIALFRRRLGHILAREQPPPPDADFVLGVPDSGIPAAHGYAEEANLPYLQEALFRLHGAERSFMEPINDLRQQGIELKLGIIPEYVRGKSVVVIDDSIVRGNVMPRVACLLKLHGAREVHVRISSPPITGPCYYGIDTWRIPDELIARTCSSAEYIRLLINARIKEKYHHPYPLDSLGYLSLEGLKSAYQAPNEMCYACWSGEYPVL